MKNKQVIIERKDGTKVMVIKKGDKNEKYNIFRRQVK